MRIHPVVILRHPKERRSKCTVEPLRGQPGIWFHTVQPDFRYNATGHLLLAVDAPQLQRTDGTWNDEERRKVRTLWRDAGHPPDPSQFDNWPGRPVLLLDSTWRHLPAVARCVVGEPLRRSLPGGFRTAYPRVNREGLDPAAGLATVEALYLALRILGEDNPELLRHYYWADAFLAQFPAGIVGTSGNDRHQIAE